MSFDAFIDGFRLSNIDAMADDDEWIDCMNSVEPNLLEVNLRFPNLYLGTDDKI